MGQNSPSKTQRLHCKAAPLTQLPSYGSLLNYTCICSTAEISERHIILRLCESNIWLLASARSFGLLRGETVGGAGIWRVSLVQIECSSQVITQM